VLLLGQLVLALLLLLEEELLLLQLLLLELVELLLLVLGEGPRDDLLGDLGDGLLARGLAGELEQVEDPHRRAGDAPLREVAAAPLRGEGERRGEREEEWGMCGGWAGNHGRCGEVGPLVARSRSRGPLDGRQKLNGDAGGNYIIRHLRVQIAGGNWRSVRVVTLPPAFSSSFRRR
jgi:hypothetical protein